jgi:phage tail-like protein
MATPRPPFSVFRFQVQFLDESGGQTITNGGFSDVSGLESNIEIKPIPEGGRLVGVHQLVGKTTFANLVLKRGLTSNFELWKWFSDVSRGVRPVPRKKVVIELLDAEIGVDENKRVVARWSAERAIPLKMRASDLSGKGTELAVEELQLAHEGLTFDLDVKST